MVVARTIAVEGLSPRGRGKPMMRSMMSLVKGSIPAWAGETSPACRDTAPAPVYPRVGGGNLSVSKCVVCCVGLSPRGRGKLGNGKAGRPGRRSIPAWAGETPPAPEPNCGRTVYPRVGGGTPLINGRRIERWGLSPRGRGKRGKATPPIRRYGSIPAWAGETKRRCRPRPSPGVYPRVGGGNQVSQIRQVNAGGLSPRGRGKPLSGFGGTAGRGSIPAWAGETGIPAIIAPAPPVYPRVGGGNSGASGRSTTA